MKKIWLWGGVAVLTTTIAVGTATMFYIYRTVQQFEPFFAKNISINGLDVGGLTPEMVKSQLETQTQDRQKNKQVILQHREKEITLPFSSFPVMTNLEAALEVAYELSHTGSLLEKYKIVTKGIEQPTDIDLEYSYSLADIERVLNIHKESFFVAPVDATLTRVNREFILTEEIVGEELDASKTALLVEELLSADQVYPIEVVTTTLNPAFTAADLKLAQNPISSFYTSYNNADLNRNKNLEVAAKKINKVLLPGESFSLGEQLEPITFDAGYRASKVIVNGRLEEGIGGGVCQIASTLYNAVLLSNLDVTLRRNHSLPVAYVPLGRDATYATGGIDFKFQNNSPYPAFIESYCENNRVYVNIFGGESLKPSYDEIKFYSELIETITPPPTKYVDDPTLEKGVQVQDLAPLEGKKVKLYKLYYTKGELVKKELVDVSHYKARAEIVKVGTKETVPAINTEDPLPESIIPDELDTIDNNLSLEDVLDVIDPEQLSE